MTTAFKPLFRGTATPGTPKQVYTPGGGVLSAILKEVNVANKGGPGGAPAIMGAPSGLCMDNSGNMFWCDMFSIRKMDANGQVTTLAGVPGVSGVAAVVDGTGPVARFGILHGLCVDSTGTNLYVCEVNFARVRKVVIATGVVTTLAGSTAGTAGIADGTGTGATLSSPINICIDSTDSNLYVAQSTTVASTYCVRKIVVATGVVTSLAQITTVTSGLGALCITSDDAYLYMTGLFNSVGTYVQSIYRLKLSNNTYIAVHNPNQLFNSSGPYIYNGGPGVGYLSANGGFAYYSALNTNGGFYAGAMAVDISGTNHKLYLSDNFSSTIRVLDIQPTSAAAATCQSTVDVLVGAQAHVIFTTANSNPSSAALAAGYPGTSRTGAVTGMCLKNGSLFFNNTTHRVIQRVSLLDGFCHVYAFDYQAGESVNNAYACIDGSAVLVGQNAYFDLFLVPTGDGALDKQKHCVFRNMALGGSQSAFPAMNMSIIPGDIMYVEPCNPGLNFRISGLEAS